VIRSGSERRAKKEIKLAYRGRALSEVTMAAARRLAATRLRLSTNLKVGIGHQHALARRDGSIVPIVLKSVLLDWLPQ
jgi:hypothetical protein